MSDLMVKQATEKDLPFVLTLMQQLAVFEGYIDNFQVDLAYLKQHLLRPASAPQNFEVLVAKQFETVQGILVFYTLPFTYDLKPWLLMKELIVDENHRSKGVGRALMKQLIELAKQRNVSKIRWDVLNSNTRAKSFYESFGAEHQTEWELYSLGQKVMDSC